MLGTKIKEEYLLEIALEENLWVSERIQKQSLIHANPSQVKTYTLSV